MTMHISHISQSQLLIAAVAAAWFGAALAADKPLGIIGRLSR
jgi:hypothetical protein